MVKEEIVEGLRFAMNKGDDLMKAMMSFYDAGYSKSEIEEAARMLNQPSLQNLGLQPQTQTTSPVQTPSQVKTIPPVQTPPQVKPIQGIPKQEVSQYGSPQPAIQTQVPQNISEVPTQAPANQQTVSNYDGKRKPSISTGVMIVLAIVLFFLLSALVSLILFKDVIAGFFGGLL